MPTSLYDELRAFWTILIAAISTAVREAVQGYVFAWIGDVLSLRQLVYVRHLCLYSLRASERELGFTSLTSTAYKSCACVPLQTTQKAPMLALPQGYLCRRVCIHIRQYVEAPQWNPQRAFVIKPMCVTGHILT